MKKLHVVRFVKYLNHVNFCRTFINDINHPFIILCICKFESFIIINLYIIIMKKIIKKKIN